jgi:DNA-binding transcriptional ArsR family regulator
LSPRSDVDSRVIKALTHPLRVRILGVLEQRTASPSDIAVELGAPLANVSYHVRQLLELKLIRLVKRTPRRGSIEHYYRADGRTQISDAAWEQVPEVVKQAMVGTTLRQISAGVNAAAAAGGLSRPEAHLSRTQLVLDQQGIKAAARELRATVDRIDRIQAASAERLTRSDHADEQRATMAMIFFEDAEPPR